MGISMEGLLKELFFEEEYKRLVQGKMISSCFDDQINMKRDSLSILHPLAPISLVCKKSRNCSPSSLISALDHIHTIHRMYSYTTYCPLISFSR